ncbi:MULTISPECIES: hypothetical protein [Pseudoalteromonas]|uniref:hypothetical protein n=1 Tax=Pseudoalteromonas TaxID=53246 RepID=UPI00083E4053|nr:hypothetical protein [Pseudoalteromonas sp. BMB]ODB35372.1 hypothetical protein BB427_17325 [Pseudoalteromonas sp. BMB]
MWLLIAIIVSFIVGVVVHVSNRNTVEENLRDPCVIKVNEREFDICINQNLVRLGLDFLIVNLVDLTQDKEVSFILTKNEQLRHGDSFRVCKYMSIKSIADIHSEDTHISVLKIPIDDLIPSYAGVRKLNFNINFYHGYPGESQELFLEDIESAFVYNKHIEHDFQCLGYADNDEELLNSVNKEVLVSLNLPDFLLPKF